MDVIAVLLVILAGVGGTLFWLFSNGKGYTGAASGSFTQVFSATVKNTTGSGIAGSQDGPSSNASFNSPSGVAADNDGNIYVADTGNNEVRRINASGYVTTLAGDASALPSFADGQGSDARFNAPIGIAFDGSSLFVVDSNNSLIRQISLSGNVTTIAGNLTLQSGSSDGQSLDSSFNNPYGIDADSSQNLYISDTGNNLVRQINSSRYIATFAGISTLSRRVSALLQTALRSPLGIAVDSLGNVFVVDSGNNQIIKINSSTNTVSTALNFTTAPSQIAIAVDPISNNLWVSQSRSPDMQVVLPSGNIQSATSPVTAITFLVFNLDGNLISSSADQNVISILSVTSPAALNVTSSSSASSSSTTNLLYPVITVAAKLTFQPTFTNHFFNHNNRFFFDRPFNHRRLFLFIYSIFGGRLFRCRLFFAVVSSSAVVTTIANIPSSATIITSSTSSVVLAQSSSPLIGPSLTSVSSSVTLSSSSSSAISLSPTTSAVAAQSTPSSKVVSTFAGSGPGLVADGSGTAALFNYPSNVVVDVEGKVYITDMQNNMIRKISKSGIVTTIAGSGILDYADGVGTAAYFNHPRALALDSSRNIYIADTDNNRIRKCTPNGTVTTIAGSSSPNYADGVGTSAYFYSPSGIAVDSSGILYISDTNNHRIRAIALDRTVTTFAGSGASAYLDGLGTLASFNYPKSIAVDLNGTLYVADTNNNRIRMISSIGNVTTLAGSGSYTFADGMGLSAAFNSPFGIAVDVYGVVYVADNSNLRIRIIQKNGNVSTLAGSDTLAYVDGVGSLAAFKYPSGVAVDSNGLVYVTDSLSNTVRVITTSGNVSTLAGSPPIFYGDGVGTRASFYNPNSVALDSNGNLYVADTQNHRVRKISPNKTVTTFAGNGAFSYNDGPDASFSTLFGIAADAQGNVFIADTQNNRIRMILPSGYVSTLAGTGSSGFGNGPTQSATFSYPAGIAVDSNGMVYVADTSNSAIRIFSRLTGGAVSTLAGTGGVGYVNGVGTLACFNYPGGVTVGSNGTVYVADTKNHVIRMISSNANVTTLAGSRSGTFADGIGVAASFYLPSGIAVDTLGNVYV